MTPSTPAMRPTSPFPPHPPSRVNPPEMGPSGAEKRRAIVKINPRKTDTWKKPVDWLTKPAATRMVLSKSASRIPQKIHENTLFIHGFANLSTACFLWFLTQLFLYPSLLPMKKREREGQKQAKQAKRAIHGFIDERFLNPRKCYKNRSVFGDFLGGFWIIRGKKRSFAGTFSNPWIGKPYKSTTYKKFGVNPRILQKNKVSPREVLVLSLGLTLCRKNHKHCAFEVYNRLVSSKKGLIGFGIPCNHCDESRRTAQFAAFSLCAPVLAARMGGRKACRFTQVVPGIPTCSSCRPRLESSATVFANRTIWRPSMATSAFSPDFVELVTGIQHDARLTSQALTSIMELLRGCDVSHQLSAGALHSLLEPIWGSLDTLCGDLLTVSNQQGEPV